MSSLWIFGYGSLVHRPGFPHARRVEGYVVGWKRVWWQGSTDHRGTPESPGRVVTMEPAPGAVTWGVAYELTGSQQQQLETLRYLEWREKQYDQRCLLDLFGPPDQDVWAHPPPLDPPHLQAQAPAASAAALRQSLELAEQQGASPERDGTPDLDQVDGKPQQPQPHQQQQGQAQNNGGGKPAPAAAAPPPAVDPLLFSEEMKQFAPPGDWDKLRAEDLLDQPAEEQAPAGPVPGTRVLLRSVLCYVASSDLSTNSNWLGPASFDEVANTVAWARGPSGENWEYVVKLAAAIRRMGVEDPELFELEEKVLAIRSAAATAAASVNA